MTTLIDDVTAIGGVDTHKHTHYAAVIDDHGRLLGHQQFPATSSGYEALRSWMRGYLDWGGEHRIIWRSTRSRTNPPW